MSIKKTLDEIELKQGFGAKWIWTALDPDSRLIICALVGNRTLKSCRKYFKKLLARIANKPLFVSDELTHYETVLRENFSTATVPKRQGQRGRFPKKAVLKVDEDLCYAVVHKERENGKVVKVERRIVFGNAEQIEEKLLQSISNKINTSYIERSNGSLRQINSHLRRKSLTFAKALEYFEAKIALTVYFYNFIRPHCTLSKNSDKSETPRTPAMVAGLTEKVWTTEYAFKLPHYNN